MQQNFAHIGPLRMAPWQGSENRRNARSRLGKWG